MSKRISPSGIVGGVASALTQPIVLNKIVNSSTSDFFFFFRPVFPGVKNILNKAPLVTLALTTPYRLITGKKILSAGSTLHTYGLTGTALYLATPHIANLLCPKIDLGFEKIYVSSIVRGLAYGGKDLFRAPDSKNLNDFVNKYFTVISDDGKRKCFKSKDKRLMFADDNDFTLCFSPDEDSNNPYIIHADNSNKSKPMFYFSDKCQVSDSVIY